MLIFLVKFFASSIKAQFTMIFVVVSGLFGGFGAGGWKIKPKHIGVALVDDIGSSHDHLG
jgi:hypothetical protein